MRYARSGRPRLALLAALATFGGPAACTRESGASGTGTAAATTTTSTSAGTIVPASATPSALSTSAVTAGWYTAAQAGSGAQQYATSCAACHGASLQGGAGPALVGASFLAQWQNRTLSDLYGFEHASMPLTNPNSLTDQQYADITAYVLQRNGFVAGSTPLTAGSPMSRILRPTPTALAVQRAANGLAPSSAADSAASPVASSLPAPAPAPVKLPSTALPLQGDLDAADTAVGSWMTYNKGYAGFRYSALAEITPANAGRLRPVCMYQAGEGGTFETGLVAYDGVLYGTTTNTTFAIDAATCQEVWRHVYTAPGATYNNTNRGLALGGGRVFRGTIDGHLLALDAKTGALLWDRNATNSKPGNFIAAAPLVWNDVVIVGRAGGDLAARGALLAFNASDGAPLWTFETIPTGNAPGAETWQKAGTQQYGGGAIWTAIALDPATGVVYAPVGNPAPDFNNAVRPGSNLYTGSIIAVDARTGALQWYNQLVPSDFHDWDMTTVALVRTRDGKRYVAASGKNGLLYLLDRDTGRTVWQTPVTTRTNTDAPMSPSGVHYCPGTVGGVEWNGPAFDPTRELLFVNAVDWCVTAILGPPPTPTPGLDYTGLENSYGTFDPVDQARGWVNAIDARTGKPVWRVQTAAPMIAAVTPSAGGVVFTGDVAGNFFVLDSRTGRRLYSFFTGGSMGGGVITYRSRGRQLVAVASGNSSRTWFSNGSPTVVVFGL